MERSVAFYAPKGEGQGPPPPPPFFPRSAPPPEHEARPPPRPDLARRGGATAGRARIAESPERQFLRDQAHHGGWGGGRAFRRWGHCLVDVAVSQAAPPPHEERTLSIGIRLIGLFFFFFFFITGFPSSCPSTSGLISLRPDLSKPGASAAHQRTPARRGLFVEACCPRQGIACARAPSPPPRSAITSASSSTAKHQAPARQASSARR